MAKNAAAKTLHQAIRYFTNPDNCLEFIVGIRWPNGVLCPSCGSREVRFLSTRRLWECQAKHPRRQFSAKVGTIFEDSAIGLDKWLAAIWVIANAKNGVSSYEISRALGVTQKTAWFMMRRIRTHTRAFDQRSGAVEADEPFVGGCPPPIVLTTFFAPQPGGTIMRNGPGPSPVVRTTIFALLALVAAPGAAVAPADAQPQVVMKIGDAGPAQIHRHFMAAASFVFKDHVERLSGGRIKVEVYPENQLGPTKALMEQAKAGVLPAVSTHASVSTLFVPAMELMFMPFAFNSPVEAWKLYDGWFGDKLKKEFVDRLGLLPLYFSDNGGGRSIGTRAKKVRTLADFKGLKIRSPDAVAIEKTLASFGAAPSKITWTEVYTSLQTGVVDGTDLGIAVFLYQPFHEVLKNVIVTNHSWDWSALMVNVKWFKSLPQEHQDIMVTAGRIAETVSRGMSETLAAEAIAQLRKQGIDVYTPTVAEREDLRRAARAEVEPIIRKKVGDKWADDFSKALEEARAEIRKEREKLYGMMPR